MGKKQKKTFRAFQPESASNTKPAEFSDKNQSESSSYAHNSQPKRDITPPTPRNSTVEGIIVQTSPAEVVPNVSAQIVSEEFKHKCELQEEGTIPNVNQVIPQRPFSSTPSTNNAWVTKKLNMSNAAPDRRGHTTQGFGRGRGHVPPPDDNCPGQHVAWPAPQNVVSSNMEVEQLGSGNVVPVGPNQSTSMIYDISHPHSDSHTGLSLNVEANEFVPRKAIKQSFNPSDGTCRIHPTNNTPALYGPAIYPVHQAQPIETQIFPSENNVSNTEDVVSPAEPSSGKEQQAWIDNDEGTYTRPVHSNDYPHSGYPKQDSISRPVPSNDYPHSGYPKQDSISRGGRGDSNRSYQNSRGNNYRPPRNGDRRDDRGQNRDSSNNRTRNDRKESDNYHDRPKYQDRRPRRDSNRERKNWQDTGNTDQNQLQESWDDNQGTDNTGNVDDLDKSSEWMPAKNHSKGSKNHEREKTRPKSGDRNDSKGYHQNDRKSQNRRDTHSRDVSKVGKYDDRDSNASDAERTTHKREITVKTNRGSWDSNDRRSFDKKTYVDPRSDRERNSLDSSRQTYDKSSTDDDYWNNSFNSSTNDRDNNSWRRSGGSGRFEKPNKDIYNRSYEKTDDEYRQFEEEYRKNERREPVKVEEIEKDLFEMPSDYSLGHCVAEDMRMGSGIAVKFKRDFKQVEELLGQRQKQGGLAYLEDNKRYVYYLVTKRTSSGKPTYETFWSSLKKMRDHIVEKEVKQLAIPRIGCGLDRLEWSKVSCMLEFLFRNVDVKITVCNFQQAEDSTPQRDNLNNKLVNEYKPLVEIEEYTIILYYASEDGHISEEMETLAKKFNILPEFKKSPKQLGKPIRHEIKNHILYGCVVRKNEKALFDFSAFGRCLFEVNKNNRKDQYEYVALQELEDSKDDLLNEKIITLLRFHLKHVNIHLCRAGGDSRESDEARRN
ncbi:unnamed protein product [Phaedon cochleariae]|uniref:Macro domain-containing protein n=1 Tax=Phaedon cochleariae TaxID=80249 RepID=A0A9P0DN31_PHACE|nr:unnamed protein product [Phaedon cochleariae]